jgi:deoxyribose-phosphate aldolase
MRRDTKAWAIKLRGRSFYKTSTGGPVTLTTKQDAVIYAESITRTTGIKAEAVRVKVRIEETT